MADLSTYKAAKNSKFEILTEDGFKSFKGILHGENTQKIKLTFSNGSILNCTPKHKLATTKEKYIYARDVEQGDVLYGGTTLVRKECYSNDEVVYELLEVSDTHSYYANGILNKQCVLLDELAFIDNHLVEEFWASVYPIISSSKKSKIFVASTPNGTGNLFHDLYSGAMEQDPEKHNGWKAERVDWWEVPGRDEKWKNKTIREMGSREKFDQEFGNTFLQTGESAIDEAFFEKLKAECAEPTFVFDEGHYLLWKEPDKERLYVVGVDVAEGVGEAASVVQVLDITDLRNIEQVAIYHNRNISPYNFTTKLHEILQHWGNPPALIERNNCGAQVVDQLKNSLRYENIVNYGSKAGDKIFNKPGVVAHTNTKYKGVTNMRYWINELNVVRIRDIKTLAELKGFVRYPNGTWAAKSGSDSHDDRVMSLIWTLMILENEVTEKYYEIVELDDNKRPQVIKSMDYGIKYFINPTSMYSNERDSDNAMPLPILISTGSELDQTDLTDLQQQGWAYLN
ncbi:large terminase protein [uncultured Caudovirales phage]|uniref:Large terminase protein n=1 Tax=uncultured Caudovirales phage TaxID=2100421 RepID=A0A6J7X9Q3_9CAUD|nr:large terminase protein [uncultured Caudovirales phage]